MTLNLLFPQWQGAGKNTDLYDGALEIRDALLPTGSYEQIDVSLDTDLCVDHGIWAYGAILKQPKSMETLRTLNDEYNIAGFSVTEYAPGGGADVAQLRDIIAFGYSL